jgi:hypothetical protein
LDKSRFESILTVSEYNYTALCRKLNFSGKLPERTPLYLIGLAMLTQCHATPRAQLFAGLGLWLGLLATALIYWRGLSSVFIYDDFVNLQKLAALEGGTGEAIRFALSGQAGPLGRPLSLLSFALQSAYWPQPWFFKYVNLLIHLLTGCLLAWLTVKAGRLAGWTENRTLWLALLASLAWLLNPMQVSTTLYAVQRMAQLAALFTVAGLLVYLQGRTLLTAGRTAAGLAWMSSGIALGGLLAILSKENGVLLPLYALVLEVTLLTALRRPRVWQIWAWLLLYGPLLLLVGYFVWSAESLAQSYTFREFTLAERLLTQPRILFDYLSNIFLPRLYSFTLFHDDYPFSRGLLNPPTTVLALGLWAGVIAAAFYLRRAYPVAAFGALWFLAGHALESTFLPLMLFFEHRNYLAMFGPLLALIDAARWLMFRLKTPARRSLVAGGGALWLGYAAGVTWSEAGMWQTPLLQAIYWAENQPLSRGGQTYAAAVLSDLGRPDLAPRYYLGLLAHYPEDIGPYLIWLRMACRHKGLFPPEFGPAVEQLRAGTSDPMTSQGIGELADSYLRGECAYLSATAMEALLTGLLENPRLSPIDRYVAYLKYAQFLGSRKRFDEAIAAADQALYPRSGPPAKLPGQTQAKLARLSWLMESQRLAEALAYIRQLREELSALEYYLHAGQLDKIEKRAGSRLGQPVSP